MRVQLIFFIYLLTTIAVAQTEEAKVIPKITSLPIEEGEVTLLHLGPGYTTSVRLPEEVSSVVIGNPASFKAEHSEAEPRLVFLKPLTSQLSESNALITTKSGHEISLHLVSAGKAATIARVDFVVEYRRPQGLLINSDAQSFMIPEIRPVSLISLADSPPPRTEKADEIAQQLKRQQELSSPNWQGKEVLASIGESIERNHQTVLGFSVLNHSKRVIELLPPQLELSGARDGKRNGRIKAEPVAVAEYQMTTRRLQPSERADGVVVFDRPAFKESRERLELDLAEAEQVDRPIVLPVPFTVGTAGGAQ
jgi:hypothetical protein